MQIIGNATFLARADLNDLAFEARSLRDFSLERYGSLPSQFFEFIALLLRYYLCLFAGRDIQANSREPDRFATFIEVHTSPRGDPAHRAIRGKDSKLRLVIFAFL